MGPKVIFPNGQKNGQTTGLKELDFTIMIDKKKNYYERLHAIDNNIKSKNLRFIKLRK